jgi:hypothetical protein
MTESTPTTPRGVDDILRRMDEERQILGQLLDQYGNRENTMLVHRGTMAGSPSFVSVRSLLWVAARVRLAAEMPFMRQFIDEETGEFIIDSESIKVVRQRRPDYSRQEDLARYLIQDPRHQFPPLLLVITAPWADDPTAPQWDQHGRAKESTYRIESFGLHQDVALLIMTDEYQLYALDGQHRVLGIKGALDLIHTGTLQPKTREGKARGSAVELADWIPADRLREEVLALPGEAIGVQVIPAVIKGETHEEAKSRIASVFVHVNQTVAPLKEGELNQIDQNNPFAIIARTIATEHPLLKHQRGRNDRVQFANNTITLRSTVLTTLPTLKQMARLFLQGCERLSHWNFGASRRRTVTQRPPDAEIEFATDAVFALWNAIAGLPSMVQLDRGRTTYEFRWFLEQGGDGHMLFRPVGQQVLAHAVGRLVYRSAHPMTLESIFEKLAKYDAAGGFRIDDPAQPWYGILYEPGSGKISVAGQDLAVEILRYMLGGMDPDRPGSTDGPVARLRDDFAQARAVGDGTAWSLDGRQVDPHEIKLPELI